MISSFRSRTKENFFVPSILAQGDRKILQGDLLGELVKKNICERWRHALQFLASGKCQGREVGTLKTWMCPQLYSYYSLPSCPGPSISKKHMHHGSGIQGIHLHNVQGILPKGKGKSYFQTFKKVLNEFYN